MGLSRGSKKPIIVNSTGYSINTEEEDDALFAEKWRLDDEFEAACEPERQAAIENNRQRAWEREQAQWASLSPLGKVAKRLFG